MRKRDLASTLRLFVEVLRHFSSYQSALLRSRRGPALWAHSRYDLCSDMYNLFSCSMAVSLRVGARVKRVKISDLANQS